MKFGVFILVFSPSILFAADLSGEWEIAASLGETPIGVHCTLIHMDDKLSGTCTPEMQNAEASELTGTVTSSSAEWGYDVTFNGAPGHIAFTADQISANKMSGTLSLSGNPVAFVATKS